MAARNNAEAASDERTIVVTRTFHAPRELVWQAWTDPRQMAQWWGPHGFTNPVCELDVRPGGAWRIEMRGPDGSINPCGGVYREVVKPERLVYTAIVEESRPPHGLQIPHAVHEVIFEERDGKTTLTIITRVASAADRDVLLKLGHKQGFEQSLERLADLVER